MVEAERLGKEGEEQERGKVEMEASRRVIIENGPGEARIFTELPRLQGDIGDGAQTRPHRSVQDQDDEGDEGRGEGQGQGPKMDE